MTKSLSSHLRALGSEQDQQWPRQGDTVFGDDVVLGNRAFAVQRVCTRPGMITHFVQDWTFGSEHGLRVGH
jgi:hypothetical protein